MRDDTYTTYKVTTTSTELPVTLDLARAQLRNEDQRFDDEYVQFIIRSCSADIEKQYGLALLAQTVKQYHKAFPYTSDTPLLLRIAPLLSVTSIEYIDSAGDTQTWDSADYAAGHYDQTAFIIPKVGKTWPTGLAIHPNAVTITYSAGFGAKSSNIPENIRSALLLQITRKYDNREDSPSTMTMASENLLLPYYRFSC